MKKKLATTFLWFGYIVAIIFALKWGLYDSCVNLTPTIWGCVMLPFIIILKIFVCFLGLVMFLTINSFSFTNTFKK